MASKNRPKEPGLQAQTKKLAAELTTGEGIEGELLDEAVLGDGDDEKDDDKDEEPTPKRPRPSVAPK